MLFFLLALLFSAIAVVALLYQNGRFVENGQIFLILQCYVLVLAGMQITQKTGGVQWIGYAVFIGTVATMWIKQKQPQLARQILALLLIIAPLSLLA